MPELRFRGSDGSSRSVTVTSGAAEGRVAAAKPVQSDMDSYLAAANGSPALQAWWQNHYRRLRVYHTSLSDSARGWLPPAWEYEDVMVASHAPALNPNPAFHLRDQAGNLLRINFGDRSQYAADIGNPNYRANYVARVSAMADRYGGAFMDDTNFEMGRVVCNAAGQFVQPWNPRINGFYTQAQWERDMGDMVVAVKAALPAREVVINTVYFHAGGIANAQVRRALAAADVWEFERGFGDTGIVPGTGKWGFETVLGFIDYCHSVGTAVVHDVQRLDLTREYVRGCYLLAQNGADYIGHPHMRPDNWWTGWDLDLGSALEPRRKLGDGTFERRFTGGLLRVNPSTRTATIT